MDIVPHTTYDHEDYGIGRVMDVTDDVVEFALAEPYQYGNRTINTVMTDTETFTDRAQPATTTVSIPTAQITHQ